MGFVFGLLGALLIFLLLTFWYGSTKRRREFAVFAFVERVGLAVTNPVLDRVDRRLWGRTTGSAVGSLVALLAFAVLFATTQGSMPLGVAGSATTGVLAAAMSLGGAVSALRQFTAPLPGAPRYARAHAPTLTDYVHPWWMLAALTMVVVSGGMSAALLVGVRPAVAQVGMPLEAVFALAVLAAAGLAAAAALSSKLLSVPQPASSELELQWDDALRAYALRDLWIASIALGTAAFVAAFSWLFDFTSPYVYLGGIVGLAPILLLSFPVSRRPLSRLWQPDAANDPSRC